MRSHDTIKILIIGAGKAGELISSEILSEPQSGYEIIGFIDDNVGKSVNGIEVLGGISDIRNIVRTELIEEILIALPSERGKVIRDIIEQTIDLKIVYKILPRLSEVLLQDFNESYLQYVRRVKPEDMLGGEILKTDQEDISNFSLPQTILITGAAGSIGSELSRQVAAHGARKVVFYDWWENGIFDLRNQLLETNPNGDYEFIIGDVKDERRVEEVMSMYRPTTIFHAAAYKHVPLMEYNATEAVKNNILGTKTVAEAAVKYGVSKFILISTDKAVNPTNIMGATKRTAEKIIHILANSQNKTTFCAVRFGNVINSNGSAIPFFEKQIEKGGPVTVTHREITRYFMTIPEAVHLILQTWVMGENDDLFVLDMGESIKIYDLARALIAMRGYIPDEEIKINITGLRPGEKLYEEVLVKEEETKATTFKKIFRTTNYMNFDKVKFNEDLNDLIIFAKTNTLDSEQIKKRLQAIVETYTPAVS
ncbi:MAG: nucleoside-diphosphate sugar epimerase/dehydratase [Candidatus Saccharimonadales bacterium]